MCTFFHQTTSQLSAAIRKSLQSFFSYLKLLSSDNEIAVDGLAHHCLYHRPKTNRRFGQCLLFKASLNIYILDYHPISSAGCVTFSIKMSCGGTAQFP